MNRNGTIACRAEQACVNTTIIAFPIIDESLVNRVECYGHRSCENTQIETSYLSSKGHLSSQNSKIYSTNGTTKYAFKGFADGFNTTIFCGSSTTNHTCNIECFGNGCHNLTIKNGGGNNTINVDCTYAEYDEHNCPKGYQIPSNVDQMPSLLDMTFSTIENGDNICNSNNTRIRCDDFLDTECVGQILDTTWTGSKPGSPICCRGRYSCIGAINITASIDDSSSNTSVVNTPTAIRCDGHWACINISTFITASGGDIYGISINRQKVSS